MTKKIYKARHPLETIHHIRNILFQTGIFVTELSDSHGDFYHSHVILANDGLPHLSISTNGKGRSPEYSLASAYAEMMERLQNNYKFFGEKYATRAFLDTLPKDYEFRKRLEQEDSVLYYELFPDEIYVPLKDLISDQNYACIKLLGLENISDLKKNIDLNRSELCVPYYSVFENKTILLPAKNDITGSNGMCAGNTPEEAIVQGLCEVFERYVLKNVMLYDYVLPQIPLSKFERFPVYEKIIKLRETKNLNVIILDGSMNMGLPVIAAIIIDKSEQKYRLQIGSATDPGIALERCLTEHFQAYNPSKHMNNINRKIKYQFRSKEGIKQINYYHQITEGDGEIDILEYINKKPNFKYKRLTYIKGENHKNELLELLKILKKNNLDLMVRDNSIMGFPAFHLYVPGMSEVSNIFNSDDIFVRMKLFDSYDKLYNIKNQSKEVILTFCSIIDQMYDKVRSGFETIKGGFLYHTNDDINEINPYLFLATLYIYTGNINNAIKYIGRFIEEEIQKDQNADLTYFFCAKQFLELLKIEDIKTVIKRLKLIYDEDIANEVIEDLSDPDKALKYYDLPTCFECENCPIKQDCKYFDVMKVVKKIQVHSKKDIDQMKIADIFEFSSNSI